MSFTDAQVSILLTYFNNGMKGVGFAYSGPIKAASAETGLTERQVKVRRISLLIQTIENVSLSM